MKKEERKISRRGFVHRAGSGTAAIAAGSLSEFRAGARECCPAILDEWDLREAGNDDVRALLHQVVTGALEVVQRRAAQISRLDPPWAINGFAQPGLLYVSVGIKNLIAFETGAGLEQSAVSDMG